MKQTYCSRTDTEYFPRTEHAEGFSSSYSTAVCHLKSCKETHVICFLSAIMLNVDKFVLKTRYAPLVKSGSEGRNLFSEPGTSWTVWLSGREAWSKQSMFWSESYDVESNPCVLVREQKTMPYKHQTWNSYQNLYLTNPGTASRAAVGKELLRVLHHITASLIIFLKVRETAANLTRFRANHVLSIVY